MRSVRGQKDLQHYDGRLEAFLGRTGYPVALEILTETAVKSRFDGETVNRYRTHFAARFLAGPCFGRCYSLDGGFQGWRLAGHPRE